MSTQTFTSTPTLGSRPQAIFQLRGPHPTPNTAAFPELDQKGYTVVKNVLSSERSSEYVNRAFDWLEGFNKGFKRDVRSTWKPENLPAFSRGGLFNRHGAHHEQWAWDVRSEQAIIDVFSRIWDTEELLVSFDAVNISLPFDKDANVQKGSWPHTDQSPLRRYKHCIQGIMNLVEVGPKDGSLLVLEGSFQLYNEFFETQEQDAPPEGWSWRDSFVPTDEQMQWFYDRGCKWKKIEAGYGDLILWDSRTIHYGGNAEGDSIRVATYVCYKPAKDIEPDALERRKKCWDELIGTSHDPLLFRETGSIALGPLTDDERLRPLERPILSDRAKLLAGIESY
ncbi:hypothetical protein I203_103563 [Kwoniella mangroviensis CBS 8507]|uniref:uncharacterized protein n=1 Tax=Kwoniella mangroviensis CBS 8507 TaxID=1296122 RepID=UPI00080D0720|nr:uncharacterized protein I203_04338 [Kwoniella mangroviensis CBS 8507]OCF66762.1 hypothetical protein I203_04338 [Kwoniella mangroviensis CBS 8507]